MKKLPNIFDAYIEMWRNSLKFKGRTSRPYFVLAWVLDAFIYIAFYVMLLCINELWRAEELSAVLALVYVVYRILVVLPMYFRRLHDTNCRGIFALLWVFTFLNCFIYPSSTEGERFGDYTSGDDCGVISSAVRNAKYRPKCKNEASISFFDDNIKPCSQSDARFCRYCGKKLVEDSLYCDGCGMQIIVNRDLQFCRNCGAQLIKEAKYCNKCGEKVTPEEV